jgi:hypothetical protein
MSVVDNGAKTGAELVMKQNTTRHREPGPSFANNTTNTPCAEVVTTPAHLDRANSSLPPDGDTQSRASFFSRLPADYHQKFVNFS